MEEFKIRKASINDAAAMLEIYAPYVLDTAITFEYDVPSEREFAERVFLIQKNYPWLVIEDMYGKVCGYAYASAFNTRAAYSWSAESSIYIRDDCRGKGYGKKLYEVLENCLRCQNVRNINACIALAGKNNTNLDNSSFFFHNQMGYKQVGIFHHSGYKFSQWYDMMWLEKIIGDHPTNVAPFIPFYKLF